MKISWNALWEAVKEPLRLLAMAVVSFGVTELATLPYEWIPVLVLMLRFTDKLLHQVGKENSTTKEKSSLTGGLTRF